MIDNLTWGIDSTKNGINNKLWIAFYQNIIYFIVVGNSNNFTNWYCFYNKNMNFIESFTHAMNNMTFIILANQANSINIFIHDLEALVFHFIQLVGRGFQLLLEYFLTDLYKWLPGESTKEIIFVPLL